MTNENPLVNGILNRWLKVDSSVAPKVDCVRCSNAEFRSFAAERWRSYKCCTFQPFLPNFYLGALLESGQDIRGFRPEHVLWQPIGLLPTLAFRQRHGATAEDEQGPDQLCTYYDLPNRRCSIWQFRPGECATYFCVDEGAKDRRELWSKTQFAIETAVAQMALVELGYSDRELGAQIDLLNTSMGVASVRSWPEMQELYRKSWEWARGLTAEQVGQWAGFDNAVVAD